MVSDAGMRRMTINDKGARRRDPSPDWWVTDLTRTQRQAMISERAMTFVAREVADILEVGKIMRFSEAKIRQFQSSSPIVSTQISTMFSAWRSQMGAQATVSKFVTLMRDAGVNKEHVRKVITREYPGDEAMA